MKMFEKITNKIMILLKKEGLLKNLSPLEQETLEEDFAELLDNWKSKLK